MQLFLCTYGACLFFYTNKYVCIYIYDDDGMIYLSTAIG